ncbi:uncharacterized protein [Musca autumnalis]|uniref:uncharacterized protein n=1 Tax=Musca autumnalis TaxID=221902 RepID=UPI003CEC51DF
MFGLYAKSPISSISSNNNQQFTTVPFATTTTTATILCGSASDTNYATSVGPTPLNVVGNIQLLAGGGVALANQTHQTMATFRPTTLEPLQQQPLATNNHVHFHHQQPETLNLQLQQQQQQQHHQQQQQQHYQQFQYHHHPQQQQQFYHTTTATAAACSSSAQPPTTAPSASASASSLPYAMHHHTHHHLQQHSEHKDECCNCYLPVLQPDVLLNNDRGLFKVYCFIKDFIGKQSGGVGA